MIFFFCEELIFILTNIYETLKNANNNFNADEKGELRLKGRRFRPTQCLMRDNNERTSDCKFQGLFQFAAKLAPVNVHNSHPPVTNSPRIPLFFFQVDKRIRGLQNTKVEFAWGLSALCCLSELRRSIQLGVS